jgi:acetyl-CoA C-acetyltransferase
LRVAESASTTSPPFDLQLLPFPVFVICEALGIDGDDPRGLTLTGGLPYFGDPGNSYSLHGIAETVSELREAPGQFGFVGANGGIMSKYSVGIYSTEPVEWRTDRSKVLKEEITALPKVSRDPQARWPRDGRDVLGALRLADSHRDHRRQARCR